MDQTLATQLGAAGVSVGIMCVGMRWLAGLYKDTQNELRDQSKACQARETALALRISTLEDRHANEQQQTIIAATDALKTTATALADNARAMERASRALEIMAEESGVHRANRNKQ
jgi:hypothetical protein